WRVPAGAYPAIVIPAVGITQADGATLKANLMAGVNVTLNLSPTALAGADANGHPLMYTPNPFQSGSSVSHWDVSLTPNALMEPAINNDLHVNLDLTPGLFKDIGWFGRPVPTALEAFTAESQDGGIMLRCRFTDAADVASVSVERAATADGPWIGQSVRMAEEGRYTTALDPSAEAGQTYFYRLRVTDRQGAVEIQGLTFASRGGQLIE